MCGTQSAKTFACSRNAGRALPLTWLETRAENDDVATEQSFCWCRNRRGHACTHDGECVGRDRLQRPCVLAHARGLRLSAGRARRRSPDDWRWDRGEHFVWREHEGRGYWRGDRWMEW